MPDNSNSNNLKSGRRIQINVPSYYKETDSQVWADLESILFQGFLTSSSSILGKSFIFKTLNHLEVQYLDFLKPSKSSPIKIQENFRTSFIAHSILILDGRNALFERPKHLHKLIQVIARLDVGIQEKLLKNLAALNDRAARLYPLVEVYIHENRSRFKWLQLIDTSVHSSIVTGIPGTDDLGLNHCQATWTALNRLLDKREQIEIEWQNAKFIGSCFNGKGVRSIDERDRARAAREKSDREDLKSKILHQYLNRATGQGEGVEVVDLPDGRQAEVVQRFRADSAQELAEQLSAALSGEKDYHDTVVDRRVQELQSRSQELEKHRRQIYSATILPSGRSIAGGDDSGGSIHIPNKNEANDYLARMEQLKLDNIERNRKRLHPDLDIKEEDS